MISPLLEPVLTVLIVTEALFKAEEISDARIVEF